MSVQVLRMKDPSGAINSKLSVIILLIVPPFGKKEKMKPTKIRDKKTPALMSMSCTNVFPFLNGLFMSSMKLATVKYDLRINRMTIYE